MIALASSALSLQIVPELGGGLARLDWRGPAGSIPILRPWPGPGCVDPLQLGMIVLAPWHNRVGGGGFTWGGRFRPLPANLPQRTPYPVHGNAFQSAWAIVAAEPCRARLALQSAGPGPYRYSASLDYEIEDATLRIGLTLVNQASESLPFGCGFHPWFVDEPGLLLEAPADRLWSFTADGLAGAGAEIGSRPPYDFTSLKPLPARPISCWMTGWSERARLVRPAHGLSVSIEASSPLEHYVLYSPSIYAGYLCFEPVSHGVDAHNVDYAGKDGPLMLLEPGAALRVGLRMAVSVDSSPPQRPAREA